LVTLKRSLISNKSRRAVAAWLAGALAIVAVLPQAALAESGADLGTWKKVPATVKIPDGGHTATLLADGRILLTGGSPAVADSEIFDPASGKVTAASPMAVAREQHAATLLKDGKVLVAGGYGPTGTGAPALLDSAELFDPSSGKWSNVGPMATGRAAHTATLLNDGRVLATGGIQLGHGELLKSTEIFDPSTASWSAIPDAPTGRADHTATQLGDGNVLFVGGRGAAHNASLKDAAIFLPAEGTWTAAPQLMNVERGLHSATVLADGRVLISGGLKVFIGLSATNLVNQAEIFDPKTRAFSQVAPMRAGRYYHGTALLPDGRVLAAGGFGVAGGDLANSPIRSAEIYDPAKNGWMSAGQMPASPGGADRQTRTTLTAFYGKACPGKTQCMALAVGGGVAQIYESGAPAQSRGDVSGSGSGSGPRPGLGRGGAAAVGVGAALVLVVGAALASRRRRKRS